MGAVLVKGKLSYTERGHRQLAMVGQGELVLCQKSLNNLCGL